jgi:electron transfer flavoprotein alpha subunit
MAGILVVAETRRGELRDVTLELITAAAELKRDAGGPLTVAVVDAQPGRFAAAVSCPGVDQVVTLATATEHFDGRVASAALCAVILDVSPQLVLAAHSIDSMGFVPAVAARLGAGLATDALSVAWDGGPVVRRGAYGDKLVVELDFPDCATAIVMLRAGGHAQATPGAEATTRTIEVADQAPATEHLGYVEVETAGVDITKAEFLLSIGRGIEDADNVGRFAALAERMGATLSVSRPLVDAGWAPGTLQVGQSGKTVHPKVYLALGISGAVQHLAGMRGAETIIAVNRDPEAPIFSVAHYGAVGDLFDITDELERLLP